MLTGEFGVGGAGGDGLSNVGAIATLSNSGAISGGNGGFGSIFTGQAPLGGAGGAGVSNAGTIATLTNSGAIAGGHGGGTAGVGGAGGAGVSNAQGATITTLTNSGTISGGNGGSGHTGGAGGKGIANSGHIATLTNTGTITHGGAGADAIYSAGSQASIGLLSNSGEINGAVDLLGGSGDTLDNSGQIFGNIALAGGDILMNQGQVYGDVMLAGGDTLHRHGLDPRRRNSGSSGQPRLEPERGRRDARSLERRSLRIRQPFRGRDDRQFHRWSRPDPRHVGVCDKRLRQLRRSDERDVAGRVRRHDQARRDGSIALNHVSLSSLVSADFKFG